MTQRAKNIKDKYLKRECLWDRIKLGNHRISWWRLGGQMTKLYERKVGNTYTPFHAIKYEVSD